MKLYFKFEVKRSYTYEYQKKVVEELRQDLLGLKQGLVHIRTKKVKARKKRIYKLEQLIFKTLKKKLKNIGNLYKDAI